METFLTHAGYGALILFGFLQACSIPISSEITFGVAGLLASEGRLNLVLVIIIGTLAEMAGSLVSYAVGRRGGRQFVARLGKYILVTQTDLDRAERFFTGRGLWAVAVGRALPLVRTFTSLVAGMIEVPALQFGLLSLVATVAWATAFSVAGYAIGHTWSTIAGAFSIVGYAIAAALIIAIVAHRVHAVRKDAAIKKEAAARSGEPVA
jgi:membrane protein DedA with SNARE-associated domain